MIYMTMYLSQNRLMTGQTTCAVYVAGAFLSEHNTKNIEQVNREP